MNEPTIVLACGARKVDCQGAVCALDLYDGPLFRDARSWALSLVPRGRIFIVSALHGFLGADQAVSRYDFRLRSGKGFRPGSTGPAQLAGLLRNQLRDRGGISKPGLGLVVDSPPALLLFVGGREYAQALAMAGVYPSRLADALPAGRELRGLGAQRAWLRGNHGRSFAV